MEEDDGIVGQIIYSTNSSTGSPLKLEGTIQGAKHGFSSFYKNKMGINPIIISIAWSLIPPILIATLFLKLKRIYNRKQRLGTKKKNYDKQPPKRTLKDWLAGRYILSIQSETNEDEYTSLTFTYPNIVLISTIIFAIIFAISLYLSSTILAKWYDPRHKTKFEGTVVVPKSLEQSQ